jgi:hypothetical protein
LPAGEGKILTFGRPRRTKSGTTPALAESQTGRHFPLIFTETAMLTPSPSSSFARVSITRIRFGGNCFTARGKRLGTWDRRGRPGAPSCTPASRSWSQVICWSGPYTRSKQDVGWGEPTSQTSMANLYPQAPSSDISTSTLCPVSSQPISFLISLESQQAQA